MQKHSFNLTDVFNNQDFLIGYCLAFAVNKYVEKYKVTFP